jgi:hypothetical protein
MPIDSVVLEKRSVILDLVARAFILNIGRPVATRQEFLAYICPKLRVGKDEGKKALSDLIKAGVFDTKNHHTIMLSDTAREGITIDLGGVKGAHYVRCTSHITVKCSHEDRKRIICACGKIDACPTCVKAANQQAQTRSKGWA